MKTSYTAISGLLFVSTAAFGIDMNMQYVQSNNGFLVPDSESPIETSAIERTIYGGGEFTGTDSSALTWEIDFHEYLAFDYKSTSQATVTGKLSYAWQNTFDPVAPWFETGIKTAYIFGGNSQLSGASLLAYLQKDRYWSDTISTSASGYIKQTYLNEETLSGLNIGTSGGLFYDVTSGSTLYINSSLEMGRQLVYFTDNMTVFNKLQSKSISNVRLSEELSQNWYLAYIEGASINTFFGINTRLKDDLAVDIAYNYTYVTGPDYEAQQNRFYASFFIEF